MLNGRDTVKLSAAVASLRLEIPGAGVNGIPANFTDPAKVKRLCAELVDFDILINNVGLFELKRFALISDDDWRMYLEVNVLSGVRLARHLMPAMLDRGWGRILVVGGESAVNVPADMIH